MKRFYDDACDKNVAVNVVYANDSNELFYDEEFENAVAANNKENLFVKGVVAIKSNVMYTAKSYNTSTKAIDFGFPA